MQNISLFLKQSICLVAIIAGLSAPQFVSGQIIAEPTAPYKQEFVITAYYSPLPEQCCYVRGGYQAEKILNGEGIKGADGTGVYAGMAAAPPSYKFGTRIDLPGIGTVEVNDRGGAIQELASGKDRLDIWMGYGEEALARALAFGVQRVEGTVFPTKARQPVVALNLTDFKSPPGMIKPFMVNSLISLNVKKEDRIYSASILQNYLKKLGYFNKRPTGYYGGETEAALKKFIEDFKLEEPTDKLTPKTAAYIMAAYQRKNARDPIKGYVDDRSNEKLVAQAQRILRYFGFYKGRVTKRYDEPLEQAILDFQLNKGVISSADEVGAGRIGPKTMEEVTKAWNRRQVAKLAQHYLDLHRVEQHMELNGQQVAAFLEEGYGGAQVTSLQNLLTHFGFFPKNKVSGFFGPVTKESVTAYQLKNKIVKKAEDPFAGVVGPQTLKHMHLNMRNDLFKKVRSEGWGVL